MQRLEPLGDRFSIPLSNYHLTVAITHRSYWAWQGPQSRLEFRPRGSEYGNVEVGNKDTSSNLEKLNYLYSCSNILSKGCCCIHNCWEKKG
ncbi:hypothetical protein OUZ56_002159 [Daphnia magna]|uniref:Uncharacterized protein n=1 Tax=Daphnia magna TaxID=35525 RepID=A0ABR0A4V0_9CRUS|nr:hypothetical protein OUZ56_002159 [Daphnia magna]